MWVARDKDGDLWLFKKKPVKREKVGIWDSESLDMYELTDAESWMFRGVKWSDKEPTEVKLVNKE